MCMYVHNILLIQVPPSIVVRSRVHTFICSRDKRRTGFGITLQGDCPVYIRSVDFDSPAHAAGIRSGDMLLEVNDVNVRYFTKLEVLENLEQITETLRLVVISGSLLNESLPQAEGKINNFIAKVNEQT